ncbi:hypothetical protein BJ912DRAFT_965704 [Pholiota molesta]|nr:hypothetical protein BJ912DRAFT_965704 [Pholiota molesta]
MGGVRPEDHEDGRDLLGPLVLIPTPLYYTKGVAFGAVSIQMANICEIRLPSSFISTPTTPFAWIIYAGYVCLRSH